ncbi:MAG TPA: hypothetical protein VF746_27680 [Longimicrobium sp.]|jgi:hypothetical protein
MFGLEILDVILGLVFIYLLLSLIVSAINEYLASMLNKRGKVLMDGLHRLLVDTGLKDDFFRHPLVRTYFRDRERLLEHEARIGRKWPFAKTLYRFFTWAFRPSVREARYPSYLPARTFAMAMLEVAQQAAAKAASGAAGGGAAAGAVSGANPGGAGVAGGAGTPAPAPAAPTIDFHKILEALRRDAGADVTEFAKLELATALAGSTLAADVRERLIDWTLGASNEAQKLHDSLEVWFNNAMDRVSGAYKRHTQYVLFWIGALLAVALNADTIDLWRRLSTDDALREGIATQAVATWKSLAAANAAALTRDSAAADTAVSDTAASDTAGSDTAAADTTNASPDTAAGGGAAPANPLARGLAPRRTPNQDSAKILLDSALAQLDRTQLDLGWRAEEVTALGLVRIDTLKADGGAAAAAPARTAWRLQWPWRWHWNTWAFWSKLLGLTLTALALSMGAPFWFDLLKKIINVRAAGRAPHERAVSPEAGGKRPADVAPK